MKDRRILVTSALPYANGHLHLGHLVEHIQTDIWVRFHKMQEIPCIAICGADAHGSPIMLKAESLGISPEALVTQMKASHEEDFKAFYVDYDNYHTTHSDENRELATLVYQRLKAKGDISSRVIKQAFDPEKGMFLPDRYVKGDCPKCHTPDQYGDSCEHCGATYAPLEMKNPRSVLSGATPIERESTHFFFELAHYEETLRHWLASDKLQPEVQAKLSEWFKEGLQAWDISRDAPYFGFEIPGEKDKYFYVWLDAPIGYLASFKNYCKQHKAIDFDEWLAPDGHTELYHFIGKDIIYFHGLFWPAMLAGADMKLPTAIYTHGFLTVNGQKMSKSRGTFIQAKTYSQYLNPEYLRYYFAAKLGPHIDDIDLNFEDFTARVNADLVGKVVNIASRSAGFIHKYFNNTLAKTLDHPTIIDTCVAQKNTIHVLYTGREFGKAVREIMQLADLANQYIDEKKPWQLIKDPEKLEEVHRVCTTAINLYRILMLYLKPILPKLAQDSEAFLNIPALKWDDLNVILTDHHINPFKPLLSRVEQEAIDKMIADSKASMPTTANNVSQAATPLAAEIEIDDFMKIDLRVAQVIEASTIEGSDKLLKLKVDLGFETRQIFAGIKASYQPEQLLGRKVVIIANLKPRKMRFGISEGMMLVASNKDGVQLIEAEQDAALGSPIK